MGEIMELIEIAQLVTGVATLLVATVLIWQMIIQKKTLDIAHNDADSNMSLYAMDTRSRTNEWFADKCTPELLDKFDKGLDSLTKKEFIILQTYIRNTTRVLTTEFRLGRLIDNNMNYYRTHFKWELRFDKKLFRDYFEEIHLEYFGRNINSEANRYIGMRDVMVEAWEEASGRKYELA